MSLHLRQTFNLFPGVRLNIGKRGVSVGIGVPGTTLNVGQQGINTTIGLPGSGLSYSSALIPYENKRTVTNPISPSTNESHLDKPNTTPNDTPLNAKVYMPQAGMNEILALLLRF